MTNLGFGDLKLPSFTEALKPETKATIYNQALQSGYTNQQIRDAAERQFGAQTDSDWQMLQGMAAQKWTPPPAAPAAPSYTPPPAPVLDTSYKQNPYLDAADQAITNRVNDNLTRYMLPQVRSGAMAAGQYGGSRQGVVEANAFNDANRNLSDSIAANRYGDYNNAMNRNLAKYQADQGYNLGLGQLQLGNTNSNRSYDLGLRSDQRANDTLDWNIDTGNYNRAVNNLGLGVGMINQGIAWQNQANQVGNTVQNAPLNYWNSFLTAGNQTGGLGGTASQQYPGNPWLGAIGGAQLGSTLYKSFGG